MRGREALKKRLLAYAKEAEARGASRSRKEKPEMQSHEGADDDGGRRRRHEAVEVTS